MTPPLIVAGLWLLFGGSHIGLAAIRGRLVDPLGTVRFTVVFYIVAAVSFAALITYYAAHRFDGAAGIGLAEVSAARFLLLALAVFGFALCAPALAAYPSLTSALFTQSVRSVRGIERVTRHPFFAGTALFALAHLLLATHLVGTVFFAGLALLATIGARHQDRKLLAQRGSPYASYLAATSFVPFAAILAGRQPLLWRELPLRGVAVGLAVAAAARVWHDTLFADGGWWIIAVVLIGAMVAGVNAWRRARRPAGRAADAPAAAFSLPSGGRR